MKHLLQILPFAFAMVVPAGFAATATLFIDAQSNPSATGSATVTFNNYTASSLTIRVTASAYGASQQGGGRNYTGYAEAVVGSSTQSQNVLIGSDPQSVSASNSLTVTKGGDGNWYNGEINVGSSVSVSAFAWVDGENAVGSGSAYASISWVEPPANNAPTIAWTFAPTSAGSSQNYTITARGHDADGNLTQVNVWKAGVGFAYVGGGNGSDNDSGNTTSDVGAAAVTFTAQAVDSVGASSAIITHTVTIAAANTAPTITWNTTPGTIASGQSYTISAHGHDADGNLTEVNVWRNGSAYAFAGGGNGYDNDSGNPSTDTGPTTITYTADAVDANGIRSATISQTVTISAPPSVTASISVSPTSATAPGATTITWSSANATALSVTGNSINTADTSGIQAVSNLSVGTYTYTITAQGSGGPATQTATFTVNAPANSAPTIAWNTAPGSVASGQRYTISAHGHDADGNLTNVNVYRDGVAYAFAGGGNGIDNDSGNPSTDTGPLTITFTADSVDANGVRSGIISQTVTVSAPAAVTASIGASPTSMVAPGSTTVTWSSANATTASVSGSGINSTATSGSQTVSGLAAGTYTFTIVAQGSNGPATQTATVTVAAASNTAPTIAWNTAPGTVASGQSYTISAHGHDADGNLTNVNVWRNSVAYAFAGGGNGSDSDAGNPTTDTGPITIIYAAEAIDAAGVHSPTISQTVTITAPPSVTGSISASPTTTTAPGSATISWSTSNATAVSVAGNGLSSTAPSGSQIVSGLAAGSYTYILTAQGAGGPITQTATVTVSTGAAVSGAISVSPSSMAWGGTATLTWTTANATSVKVSGYGITGSPYQNTPSLTVSVGGLSPGQTTWTLIADGAGGPITRTATINVTTSDGLYGSITTSPTVIYSNQTATLNWTTTGAGFRWLHGYQPGMNGVNIYPAAVSGSTTVSSLPPGDYRFTIEYGPGSSTTRMSFADLTVLGVNRAVVASVLPIGTGSVTGSGTYAEGASATLTATPDATHLFAGWSGDLSSAANPLTFTVGARNYNVVANFALRTFAVTASVSPVGAGSVTGAGNYTAGATATLSATPNATHVFTGWSGGHSGSANPVSFVVNAATNVTANFVPARFVLTTAANTGGTVTPGGTYPSGMVVTVTAAPESTHRFINWTGDASGTAATTAVTLDRAKLVQANFSAKTAQTITFDPPGDHGLTSPPFAITASATSGLPVSFSLLGGPAILTGSYVEVTGAGPVTLEANQPGDGFFLPAAPVNQTFNVIAAATLKYRGQSRTLLRDETTRAAPPFVLEKP